MSWIPTVLLSLAVLALAAATGLYLGRASRARRELSERLHDATLALDRRCDLLQEQVLAFDRRQRVEHLAGLVDLGEARGELTARVARDLRRYVADLRSQSLLARP